MATFYNSGLVTERYSNRVQDWAAVIIAIWFFISPWVLQFGAGAPNAGPVEPVGMVSTAAWNAWVMAVLVFLVALSAVSRMEMWQEWINLIFGAWIFAAPWALGFTPLGAASWDHWIVGALVFLLSLWSMSGTRAAPTGTMEPPATRQPRDL